MKDSYYTDIALRMRHPTIDVGELCKKMNLVPDLVKRKGELVSDRPGFTRRWDRFYCSIRFDIQARQIDDYMQEILKKLEPNKADIINITESGGLVDFFIGIFVDENGGEDIDLELISLLHEFKIRLSLCLLSLFLVKTFVFRRMRLQPFFSQ